MQKYNILTRLGMPVIDYLEAVTDIDNEGRVVRSDSNPLAVLEHLQAAHFVLVQDAQHLRVGVAWNPKHSVRVGAHRVVVHASSAVRVRRLQARECVSSQAQRLG